MTEPLFYYKLICFNPTAVTYPFAFSDTSRQ